MTTTLVLRFDKHEIRIRSPEPFETVSVLNNNSCSTADSGDDRPNESTKVAGAKATSEGPLSWFVSLALRESPTVPLSAAVITSASSSSASSSNKQHSTPAKRSDVLPAILTSRGDKTAQNNALEVHPIYTPRIREKGNAEPFNSRGNETSSEEGSQFHVDDSDDDDEDVTLMTRVNIPGTGMGVKATTVTTMSAPTVQIVDIPGIGPLMPYTASMYRSSTLSMAQSILEITYRRTGRLAWSRLCPRLNLSHDQSERPDKDAMVMLVATRLAKYGIITDSFPPEGSRRVWLVPLDHTENQGLYVVIAKSRGRKLRVALKETFPVELETGKRGLQHDHFLSEILARNLWWLSSKPVELVMMPKPLYQSSYWIEHFGWSSVTALIGECNQELGTNIILRSYEEFMEIINQRK